MGLRFVVVGLFVCWCCIGYSVALVFTCFGDLLVY